MDTKTNTPPAVVLKRVIKAKRDRVFAAWTKPELMMQWFYCGVGQAEVTNDLRVGGAYQNKMILGPKKDGQTNCASTSDSNTHVHYGEYLELTPPEKIVFTWSSSIVKDSRVTVELRDFGDSTELTLTHELLDTEALRDNHTGGWEGCLANLITYLE